MQKNMDMVFRRVFIIILVLVLSSCRAPDSKNEGVYVMFDGEPKINQLEVYFHGRDIGKILERTEGNGSVTQIKIKIDPQFEKQFGEHWAFYAKSGRLTAGRLNSTGKPIRAGDRLCGFHSKMNFTWFKIKTLLSHRLFRANRLADKLYLRFMQS